MAPISAVKARPGTLPRANGAAQKKPDPVAAARAALEAELAKPLPPVPDDRAGRVKWLEDASTRETSLKKHLKTLRDAWFDGKLSFDDYTALSRKEFAFEAQVSRVKRSLEAPATAPAAPGGEKSPGYLTPELLGAIEKHPDNPLVIFGVMFLPITLIVDGMTGLSKLAGGGRPAEPARMGRDEEKESQSPAR